MPRSFFGVEEFFGINWNIVSGRHRFSRTMQHVNVKLMNIHNLVHRLLFIDEGLTSCVSTALYSAGQQIHIPVSLWWRMWTRNMERTHGHAVMKLTMLFMKQQLFQFTRDGKTANSY